jgi:hypothetical protein
MTALAAVTPAAEPPARSGFPVWRCPDCELPNDMLRATCRGCEAHRPCEHYNGVRHCGKTPVRMYPNGPKCDPHKP